MSRIDSEKVNLGSSFVLTTSDEQFKAQEILNAKNIAAQITEKAHQQAQNIIEEAKAAAQKYKDESLTRVNEEVDSIREEARQSGYQQGYDEGKSAIYNDLASQIENVEKFTASEFEIKKRIIKSAHSDIVNLVTAISEKICKKALDLDSGVLYNITKAAINELKEKESVNIIVNPSMASKIYEISENLKKDILSLQTIKIIEDSSVSEDGTIVESISSRVDNRVSSQIDEITQKLLAELQSVSESQLVSEVNCENELHD